MVKVYTREDLAALTADDTDLAIAFSAQDYITVASDDEQYVYQSISDINRYGTFLFKNRKSLGYNAGFTVTWKGKWILSLL